MTSTTLPPDELAEPSANDAPTHPNPILTSAHTDTGAVRAEVIPATPLDEDSAPSGAAPDPAQPAPDAPPSALLRVIARLSLTPLDDTAPVLIPACLAHMTERRETLAHELGILHRRRQRDQERLDEMYDRAATQEQGDAVSADLRDEMAQYASQIVAKEAEEAALADGRGTLTSPRFVMTYNLSDLLTDTDDLTPTERAAHVLSDNPIIGRLQENERGRATSGQGKGLLGWHAQVNARAVKANPTFGRVVASPWLIAVAIVCALLAFSAYTITASRPVTPGTAQPATTTIIAPTTRSSTPTAFTPPADSTARPAQANIAVAYMPQHNRQTTDPTTPTTISPTTSSNTEPHGQFMPPSQLALPAFQLTLPINRARTQETTDAAGQPRAAILPPAPGELTHYGAYPGETGTLWLFASQKTLGRLRTIQEKDQLVLTDRTGTTYTYRVLPFSPSGQPERLIDLNTDGWMFDAPSDVATLIIVLPPAKTGQTPNASQGADDDFSTSQRLAYRAALERIAPATTTPRGTPVFIPDTLYTPQRATPSAAATATSTAPTSTTGAATPPTTPSISATPTPPTPSTALPGLPDTGGGSATDAASRYRVSQY